MANGTGVGTVKGGANFVYNVNDTSTQVLASKMIKENIFVGILHRNGKGITEQTETDVSSLRMMKVTPITASARKLGENTNGGFFNSASADIPEVTEYDLNLLYLYDKMIDLPEVQQDMVGADLFEATMKNVAGRIATEINASTIAEQLAKVYNAVTSMTTPAWTDHAVVLASTAKYYDSFLEASIQLDNGDSTNGIQSFPFEEREFIMRPEFRKGLMSGNGVLLGGSNFAQSMLAKGAVDPESRKEYGSMYCGEIDLIPCYIAPKPIWDRAKDWLDTTANDLATGGTDADAMAENCVGIMCAASATDRGISGQSYTKIIDSPNGAGKRVQPKTRWGINVCYDKGIVPILKYNTAVPALKSQGTTYPVAKVVAPGNAS